MMTFRSSQRTALACAFLLAGGMANAAPVVTNGSFEAPVLASPFEGTAASIPGWTHGGVGDGPEWAIGYSDGGGSVTVAGSGSQFVTMGGGNGVGTGTWETFVTGLIATHSYRLDFMMAAETGGETQSLTVSFPAGSATPSQLFSVTGLVPANYWRDWHNETMNLIANASTLDLRFSATVVEDVGLDNVRVTDITPSAVPEPGSLALAALGLLGLGFCRRKRA